MAGTYISSLSFLTQPRPGVPPNSLISAYFRASVFLALRHCLYWRSSDRSACLVSQVSQVAPRYCHSLQPCGSWGLRVHNARGLRSLITLFAS